MQQPVLRGGGRHLHSQSHHHIHHHIFLGQPAEDTVAQIADSSIKVASSSSDEQRSGSGTSGEGYGAAQFDPGRSLGGVPFGHDGTDPASPPLPRESSAGRIQCKVGNSGGALSRAGASALHRNRSNSVPCKTEIMSSTADMWNKYERSKSTTRTRMDRHPRWSTLVDGAQDRRVDERLNSMDAQNQWLQKRSFVQRQFRELHDSDVKRRLVGDPRLRETFDTHFIAKLKQEDIQRDRDRARKIKGVMQDVAQARHQLIQMQQQFREAVGEEPPPRPEIDILQQFRANVIHA